MFTKMPDGSYRRLINDSLSLNTGVTARRAVYSTFLGPSPGDANGYLYLSTALAAGESVTFDALTDGGASVLTGGVVTLNNGNAARTRIALAFNNANLQAIGSTEAIRIVWGYTAGGGPTGTAVEAVIWLSSSIPTLPGGVAF